MAKYNSKYINAVSVGLNTDYTTNFQYDPHIVDGECTVRSPKSYANIYSYTGSGTNASPYAASSGIAANVATTTQAGMPTFLPYVDQNYYLISDVYAKTSAGDNLGIGYPVIMVQAGVHKIVATNEMRLKFGQYAVAGKQSVSINLSTCYLHFALERTYTAGPMTSPAYWNPSTNAWQYFMVDINDYYIRLSNDNIIPIDFTFYDSDADEWIYTLTCKTNIGGIQSIETHVSFRIVKYAEGQYRIKIDDISSAAPYFKNIYHNKYFNAPMTTESYVYSHLPLFGKGGNL